MMSLRPSRLALVASALLLVASLAGCVDNVQDLKDRVTGIDEPVDTASTDTLDGSGQVGLPPASGGSTGAKPPVARIGVFGADGAIVFKSSFAADETQVATLFTGGDAVTFSAADSEAVDTKATLTEYAWTLTAFTTGAKSAPATGGADAHAGHDAATPPLVADGGHDHGGSASTTAAAAAATGASMQHTFPPDGGVFLLTLTVKDSQGASDAMALKIGVNPAPVTKSVTFKGTIQAGNGHNVPPDAPVSTDKSTHVFNITGTINDLPAMPSLATLTLKGLSATALDLDLDVTDPTGAAAGTSHTDSSSDETLALNMPKTGDWLAIVSANLGVAGDYELVVDIIYEPTHPDVVAVFGAAAGGDGHGHAH